MTAKALTQSEINRLNEIYAEMGLESYEKEAQKTTQKAKNSNNFVKLSEFSESDDLSEFCENYQDLLLA